MPHYRTWTDAQIEQLKVLYAKGLSFAKIAQAIGGVSRNACIGKTNRLGIAKRTGSGHGGKRVPSVVKVRLVAPEPAPPVTEPDPLTIDGKRVTLMMLRDGMCKFPIGDPTQPDFHFCARPAKGSYCVEHRAIAFQPLKPLAKGFAP